MINRKQAPVLQPLNSVAFTPAQKETLSNGIPVYLVEGGSLDVQRIELIWDQFNPLGFHNVERDWTLRMASEGTKSTRSKDISELFDYYGAYLEPEAGFDQAMLSLATLTKHSEFVLPMFAEVAQSPSYPEKELEIFRSRELQNFDINKQKVAHLARKQFFGNYFGKSHPYGFVAERSDLENLSRERLKACHEELYHAGRLTIFISGKNTRKALEQVELRFGKLPYQKVSETVPAITHEIPKGSLHIEKSDALQNAIRMGFPVVDRHHKDFNALRILNTIYGGYFGSRLMSNIREEKGYTYGIGSSILTLKGASMLVIGTEVGSDVCGAAIEEIVKEMNRLKTELIPTEELETVKQYLRGQIIGSFDGPFQQADRNKSLLLFGLEPSFYEQFLLDIDQTTPELLLETANKYFIEENFFTVTAGK